MAYYYNREADDEIDEQLLESGWLFAGTSLFSHPKIYNRFFTKEQALSIQQSDFNDSAEIIIPVKGPHAVEVVADFWAWFLDGGGAEMFGEFVDQHNGEYSAYDTYDEEKKRWFIQTTEGKEE